MNTSPEKELIAAIEVADHEKIKLLLTDREGLLDSLRPPALAFAKTIETAEFLQNLGADISKVTQWWEPGFNVRRMDPTVGRYLIQQGAAVSPHAAAALGLTDVLRKMTENDPQVVDAKGGDGCTPLHFARDLETAQLLVSCGSALDARDDDHNSTPAQWLIGDAPEVARFLIEQGATPDIFMAAVLGDRELVERLIESDPNCLSFRVGKGPFHPIGHEDLGGTILQWSLGFNSYAHQYAYAKGHTELFQLMFDRSDTTTRFLVACVMAMRSEAEEIARDHRQLVGSLDDVDKELLARYCWETNVDVDAVRLMLDLGFPIDLPETSHGYSPLHNAAWGGYAELVDLLIERGAPVDMIDPVYSSTPLGFAIHCCVEDGRHPEGEYGKVVRSLIEAGSPWNVVVYPTGDPRIDEVLEPLVRERFDGVALLGDFEAVKRYLANSPRADELTAALVAAAHTGHLEICDLLLDAGAQFALDSQSGWTPLHSAVAGGSVEVVKHLLNRGADIHALNHRGGTVWHTVGCFPTSQTLMDLLMNHSSVEHLNRKSNYGFTPLDLALDYSDGATAEYLRKLGAKTS